jgi:hypothetical protein
MVKKNTFLYFVFMILGEFFIILDAGFVGYSMEHGIKYALEKYAFWILLLAGVLFRFMAEKFNKK